MPLISRVEKEVKQGTTILLFIKLSIPIKLTTNGIDIFYLNN